MKAEMRADGKLTISGYANVPGRESRVIRDRRGPFIEVIKQGAFQRAIDRAEKIDMLLDHDKSRVLASTSDGTLSIKEDAVGLKVDSVVSDPEVIEEARAGHLRGWSFNMKRIKDKFEPQGEGQPERRTVNELDMDEVTLVDKKIPCYTSTSIEVRAGETENEETRAIEDEVTFTDLKKDEPKYDNSEYKKRIENL